MPLFFFLSGLVSPIKAYDWKDVLIRIKNRFLQLVIPFILWYLILWIPLGHDSLLNLFLYPDRGLWFLWVIFLDIALFYLVLLLCSFVHVKPHVIFIIVYVAFRLIFSGITLLGLNMVSKYFLWFVLGAIIGEKKEKLPESRFKSLLIVVFLIGYLVFSHFWYRIDSVIPSGSLAMKINHLPFFSEMTAFMGIGFVVLLFASIKAPKWLGIIGKMTLGIYAVHQSLLWIYQMLLYKYPYIKTLLGNFWADTIIGFVVLFSLSVIVYRTLAIWSFSNKYLLGKS